VLVGARLVSQLEEDAAAVGASLPPEAVAALDAAFPP
jgi:aryl-alcohol dehydrogenase-like predicted oxidoreductase